MDVSVIIPCYNCERYIEETINSIFNQSYKEIEIICVDNNSNDSTLSLLNKIKNKHPQVSVYEEPRAGANYARNLGLSKSIGKYIQFLDSDDLITKTKIEDQLNCLIQTQSDFVISDRAVFNQDFSKKLEYYNYSEFLNNPISNSVSSIVTSGNPLYTSEFVKQIGGYLDGLISAQDWEFHIRAFLKKPKVTYLKGEYFTSRQVSGSLSSNFIGVSNNACHVINLFEKELLENKVYEDEKANKKIIYTYFISYLNSDGNDFLKGLLFWYSKSVVKNVFSSKNQLVIRFLGFKNGVKFLKFINRVKKVFK